MSAYEKQIRATEQYYDQEMRKVEQSGDEILSSVVPGSNLHRKIHNPVTEGIDESAAQGRPIYMLHRISGDDGIRSESRWPDGTL